MPAKSPFEPTGGMFSSDLWNNLDDDTKNLFRELLKQSGIGMQIQNENARIAQSNFRPGQYMSERQRREVINPESAAERKARLSFHGGMANGKWVTDYDTYKATRTAADDEKAANMRLAFSVPSARDQGVFDTFGGPQDWVIASSGRAKGDYRGVRLMDDGSIRYSFGNTTKSQQRRADALSTLRQYTPDRDKRIKDLEDAYNMLKDGVLGADKGGAAMRERGWLDAVFNGGIVRAALKGGKGSK